MCIKYPKPAPLPSPPPTLARINPGAAPPLPTETDLVKPEQEKGVEYGSSRKEETQAAGNKAGAKSLRIKLDDDAANPSASSGGVTA